MGIERAVVEELLSSMEQIHKPNRGVIAELCRTWLAVEAAPTGIGSRDRLEENASSIIMHVAIPAAANQFQGKRVRLLALGSGGAGEVGCG